MNHVNPVNPANPVSVFEMPYASKDHRQTMFIRGSYYFVIPDRTARLDHRRDAVPRSFINPIAKREEGIRSEH